MSFNQNPPAEPPFHGLSMDAALEAFKTSRAKGLSFSRVEEQRARHGTNQLEEAPPIPLWKKFLSQFNELVIWILIVAAVLSGMLGDWTDAAAILAIVLLNGFLSFIQEEKAGRALDALKKLSAPIARVRRDGIHQTVPARELVPGDIIELEAGDHVPADGRLIEAYRFQVQEAALTGESVPIGKDPQRAVPQNAPIGDRGNMVYMGTVAAAGKASAVVTAIGMKTELGRIAGLIERVQPEPTPLEKRLAALGKILVVVCLAIVGLVFLLQLVRGGKLLEVFLISVSLAVAAVPEGLPAVVTLALALGLQRMAKRNAIIRKLHSVETLGSVNVICTDKTGTLTRNEMTVREMLAGGTRYQVTGAGFIPRGQFLKLPGERPVEPAREADLQQALLIGARCNHARVAPRGDGSEEWRVIGDPTDGALAIAALKAGIEEPGPDRKVLHAIPFDSERKMMSMVVEEKSGDPALYAKGAPEVILPRCVAWRREGRIEPFTEADREEALRQNSEMAARALRVLALAYRDDASVKEGDTSEARLIFAGLAGMMDPPREEVKESVEKCRQAGIKPVMITGDHPETALAIARELGIAAPGDRACSGQELDDMPDDELIQRVDRFPVYARVSAEHKLRIVRAWKARGQVVAMTGDGVNDAPAVKVADIGIAMGISGTDVTKEASAMVLVDDNFTSIVSAVEEGRGIYDNIQKVLQYLLSCNLGEIAIMLVASLLGWPPPLLPIQLLWINLVTDGLPALALSLEPPEPGIMKRRPRGLRESMLPLPMTVAILLQGMLVALVTLAAFGIFYTGQPDSVSRARTVAFCVIVFDELFRSLAGRSNTLTLPRLGFFTNPYLLSAVAISFLLQLAVVTLPGVHDVFETVTRFSWEWLVMFGLALIPITIIEIVKLMRARKNS